MSECRFEEQEVGEAPDYLQRSRVNLLDSKMKPLQAVVVVVVLAVLLESAAGWSDAGHYLNSQNTARQAVGAGIPDLNWSQELKDYATTWATDRANNADCAFAHSGGPYGENLYWSSGSSAPVDAVNKWVNEKQYYEYGSNSCAQGHVCGHYTQVVWRDTQLLGCGSSNCPEGATFVVCSYDPPGNVNDRSNAIPADIFNTARKHTRPNTCNVLH